MKFSLSFSAILAPSLLLLSVQGIATCPTTIITAIAECFDYIPPTGDFVGGRDTPPTPDPHKFPVWHLEIVTTDKSADRAFLRGNMGTFAVFCKTSQLSTALTELARVSGQGYEAKKACYDFAQADWCSRANCTRA